MCTAKRHDAECRCLTFRQAAIRIGVSPRTIRGYFSDRLFNGFPGFLVAATRGKVWLCELDAWEARRARNIAHGRRA